MKIFCKFFFLIIFSPLYSLEHEDTSWLSIIPQDVFRLICIDLSKDEAISFISLSICSKDLYDKCLKDKNLIEVIAENLTSFDFPVLSNAPVSQRLTGLSLYNGKTKINVYIEDKDFPNELVMKYDGFVLSEKGQVYRRNLNNDEYVLLKGDLENRLITQIYPSGFFNNLALDKDSKVYQWFGEEEPSLVRGLEGKQVIFIQTIDDNNFVLTKNGEIYTWGRNNVFQLGLGHDQNVNEPVLIKGCLKDKRVILIDLNKFFNMAGPH